MELQSSTTHKHTYISFDIIRINHANTAVRNFRCHRTLSLPPARIPALASSWLPDSAPPARSGEIRNEPVNYTASKVQQSQEV